MEGKIYIAWEYLNYDGSYVLGIFEDEDDATNYIINNHVIPENQAPKKYRRRFQRSGNRWYWDYGNYAVVEHQVTPKGGHSGKT